MRTICDAAFLLLCAACKDHEGVHVIWRAFAFAQRKGIKKIHGLVPSTNKDKKDCYSNIYELFFNAAYIQNY
jgi:DNA polymerase III alpha subunit (gram-positive type)